MDKQQKALEIISTALNAIDAIKAAAQENKPKIQQLERLSELAKACRNKTAAKRFRKQAEYEKAIISFNVAMSGSFAAINTAMILSQPSRPKTLTCGGFIAQPKTNE